MKFSAFALLKKANFLIELQKCNSQENCDRLLVSKLEFLFEISQRKKNYLFVHFPQYEFVLSKKCQSSFVLENQRAQGCLFFSSKFESFPIFFWLGISFFLKGKAVFFTFYLRSLTMFQLSVGYVFF